MFFWSSEVLMRETHFLLPRSLCAEWVIYEKELQIAVYSKQSHGTAHFNFCYLLETVVSDGQN